VRFGWTRRIDDIDPKKSLGFARKATRKVFNPLLKESDEHERSASAVFLHLPGLRVHAWHFGLLAR